MPIWIDVGDGMLISPPPAVPPPSVPPATPAPQVPPAPTQTVSPPIPEPGQRLIDVGDGTVIPAPPVSSPPAGETGGGSPAQPGYPAEDPADWPDPEEGDAGFTDEQLTTLEAEADAIDAGERVPLASSHPPPGTIIGEPYQGTHGKAFNVAGGSDNWESENAVDIWCYPGTHVLAVDDGTISPGGWGYGQSASGGRFAGWRVHLVCSGGRVFYYTHMAALYVTKGQRVRKGDAIGPSGVANGVAHLHFAVNPPFDPHVWAAAALDLKHRTAIGTSPTTGGPPGAPSTQAPAGVARNWRDLVDVFKVTVPRERSKVLAVADSLKGVFK